MPNITFKTLTPWQDNYQLNLKMHSSLLSLVLVFVSFQVIQSAPIPKPFFAGLLALEAFEYVQTVKAADKYEDIQKKDKCLTSAGYASSGLSYSGGSGRQTGTGGSSSGGSPPQRKIPLSTNQRHLQKLLWI